MRIDALDDLAVELHDQAQHAVRGRMLRAEVDRVVADRLVARVARMAELGAVRRRANVDFDLALLRAQFGARVGSCFTLAACAVHGWLAPAPCFGLGAPAPVSAGFSRRSCGARRRSSARLLGGLRRRCAATARRALRLRLLVARKHIFGAFPRHQEVEGAEILRQRDRLVDDALLVLGIAQLDIAGEREVLALRMALEAVIGEDPAQVGVAARTRRRTCRTPRARASRRPATDAVTLGTGVVLVGRDL